ncbi:hypothetical protein [Bordetella sp. BOR01]|uniref:hypothetical protein n=1 Tax=Bordetella sp. BOR01 TaxID=2854779 RepID=UPI001C45EAFC|nr:hypothetical protein [Bordetella sp. BOR01]MBV7485601.1 hypothetical protein [Bordetella sp. BOR01]
MSKSQIDASIRIVNIQVGALTGPSDTVMLRITCASDDSVASKNDAATPPVKIYALTNDQAEDLALQLANALRWIQGKPQDRFH